MESDDLPSSDIYEHDLAASARRFPRQLAASLQAETRLLDEIMDCVDDLVLILDPGLRIVRANRCVTAFFGYAASELITKPLSLLLGATEASRIEDFARQTSDRRGGSALFLMRSRREVRLQFSLSPLAQAGEKPRGFLLVGRIAADGNAAPLADPSNGLAERMLRGFSDPLFIIDGPSRTVRDCNEAAVATFGFSHEDFRGRRLFDSPTSETERAALSAMLGRAEATYATSGIFQERANLPTKSGPRLPCDLTGLPFFDPGGSLDFIIVLAFDRSEEEERKTELSSLIGRVNALAAELAAAAVTYSNGAKATRLSELGFTARQVEIARLVAGGSASKEIASRLGIAESTVKNHLAVMFRKLGVNSRMAFMRELTERHIRIA